MSTLPTTLAAATANGASDAGGAPSGAGTPSSAAPATAPAATPSPTFSPLYQQIKALIMKSLQSGEWKPGEMIPSEMELASRFKVSQGTVRKAIDELAADNLVARRQGKGTFVTTHHEDVVKFRFLRLVPDEGSRTTARAGCSNASGCARRPKSHGCSTCAPATAWCRSGAC